MSALAGTPSLLPSTPTAPTAPHGSPFSKAAMASATCLLPASSEVFRDTADQSNLPGHGNCDAIDGH